MEQHGTKQEAEAEDYHKILFDNGRSTAVVRSNPVCCLEIFIEPEGQQRQPLNPGSSEH